MNAQPPEGRAPGGEYQPPVWLALLLRVVPVPLLLRVQRHLPYAIREPLLRHLVAWVGQGQPMWVGLVPADPSVAYDGPAAIGVLPDASLGGVQPDQTFRRYANLSEVTWSATRREPLSLMRPALPSRERVQTRARESRPRRTRTRAGASRDGPSRSDDDPHEPDRLLGRSRGRRGVVPGRARR